MKEITSWSCCCFWGRFVSTNQFYLFKCVMTRWAHLGIGVHSEALHWHLLTKHTFMSPEKIPSRKNAPHVMEIKVWTLPQQLARALACSSSVAQERLAPGHVQNHQINKRPHNVRVSLCVLAKEVWNRFCKRRGHLEGFFHSKTIRKCQVLSEQFISQAFSHLGCLHDIYSPGTSLRTPCYLL